MTMPRGYTMVKVVDEGRGTRVWHAKDSSGLDVAVKIKRRPASPDQQKKAHQYWMGECEAGKALSGKHIRKFLDCGEELEASAEYPEGYLFVVFEWVDYGDLRRLLDFHSPLPLKDTRDLVVSLSEGLATAHEHPRRFVHRDLKPENIFLPGGRCAAAQIGDFGIARAKGDQRLTTKGHHQGTDLYIAPEQVHDSSKATPESDQYSMALVIWECLSGMVPHNQGLGALTIEERLRAPDLGEVPIPGRITSHVSAVLRKALEKLPTKRFKTVRQFADALIVAGAQDGLWSAVPGDSEVENEMSIDELNKLPQLKVKMDWVDISIVGEPGVALSLEKYAPVLPVEVDGELYKLFLSAKSLVTPLETLRRRNGGKLTGLRSRVRKDGSGQYAQYELDLS